MYYPNGSWLLLVCNTAINPHFAGTLDESPKIVEKGGFCLLSLGKCNGHIDCVVENRFANIRIPISRRMRRRRIVANQTSKRSQHLFPFCVTAIHPVVYRPVLL